MSLTLGRHFGVVGRQGGQITSLRRFGVPAGGAFDKESMALANALTGNRLDEQIWELSMAQATFRVESEGVVGVVGAKAEVRYGAEILDSGTVFAVGRGDEFVVDAPTEGARVYVSIGSSCRDSGWRVRLDKPSTNVTSRNVVRVVEGPQAEMFDRRVLDWPFTVSRTGNRVGIRLEESIGAHKIELPSEPQCVGAIQVTNDGTPILIGPDGPTIGGYPKIAVVASCDIGRVAQLTPGDMVRFEQCTVERAREIAALSRQELNRRIQLLQFSIS